MHTFKDHTGSVLSVCFSNSGKYFVTGSFDKTIYIYSINYNYTKHKFATKICKLIDHTDRITSVCFNYNDTYLGSGSNDHSSILYLIDELDNKDDIINNNSNNNDKINKLLINNNNTKSKDNNLVVKKLHQFNDHTHWINNVAFSPNGEFFASASRDKSAIIYGVNSNNESTFLKIIFKLTSSHIESYMSGAFSPNGSYYATGSADSTSAIYSVDPLNKQNYGKQVKKFIDHKENTAVIGL